MRAKVPALPVRHGAMKHALQRYFEDRRNGDFGFHFAEIVPFDPWPKTMT
jgi:hypothetical protein